MAQCLSRAIRRCGLWCGVILGFWFPLAGAGMTATQPTDYAQVDRLLVFDIPAQPLEAALFKYGETSLMPALYPSELVRGLRASAVKGRFSSEEALRRLLAGTGLSVQRARTQHGEVFRLGSNAGATALPQEVESEQAQTDLNGYPARVQSSVMQALCAHPLTAPGPYRALIEFGVDTAGKVDAVTLVEPTGEPQRDGLLMSALQRLHLGKSPSATTPAVYTIALLPAAPGTVPPCRHQTRAAP